ncbi:glycosyltransferase, partial [Candidatus Dojkabacteria bacterium]|nr:glycosyltransferase [Candidatus Dojkabacteria bacterium]
MQRKLSLVIPTYNERENIIKLIDRLAWQFERHHIAAEIIVVDDNSPDGTGDLVAGYKYKNLKLVRRAGKQGLSSAVIAGWRVASGDVLGVMDAD